MDGSQTLVAEKWWLLKLIKRLWGLSKTLREPVFERQVRDVLKMTGIMCHERGPMVLGNGGDQGVFFTRRPAYSQQFRAEGSVDSRRFGVKRHDVDACHEFGEYVQILRNTLRVKHSAVQFAQHDGTDGQVVDMRSYPLLNGHDVFQRCHTHVGIEMVEHRLGERDAGFVPIAIDLIKGLIQLWIIAPAAKGLFQVRQPIDADLDLDLCPVWKKNGFLKFDRGAVNFPFDGLSHTPTSCSGIILYLS